MPPTTTPPAPEEAVVDSPKATATSLDGINTNAPAFGQGDDSKGGVVLSGDDDIDKTIIHPGAVRINVEGAFIVDSHPGSPAETPTPKNGRLSPSHETSDIRLPNHTAVVSHIAVDVSCPAQTRTSAARDIPECNALTGLRPDRWLPGEASLLHPRSPQHRARRQAQFPQLRDGPDRRLPRVHEPPEQEAGPERVAAQRAVRHGHWRRRIQVLRQNPGRPRRGRDTRG